MTRFKTRTITIRISEEFYSAVVDWAKEWRCTRNHALERMYQELRRHMKRGELPEHSPLQLPAEVPSELRVSLPPLPFSLNTPPDLTGGE